MPFGQLFNYRQPWTLIKLDPPPDVIVGQFRAEEYREDVRTSWAELPVPKREEPHLQWVRGESDIGTFNAQLWAENIAIDVQSDLDKLKAAVKPDPLLARPPQFRFIWGRIEYVCIIESIGGITYTDLWPDGRIKGARLELTLRRVELQLVVPATGVPLPTTRYRPVVRGDLYESIAQIEYEQPNYGVFLRQDATVAFPGPGYVVPVLDRRHYIRRPLEPVSYSLGSEDDAVAVRQALFDDRGKSRFLPHVY